MESIDIRGWCLRRRSGETAVTELMVELRLLQ